MKSSQKVFLSLFSQEISQIIFHKTGTFVTWINLLDCFSSVTREKYLAEILCLMKLQMMRVMFRSRQVEEGSEDSSSSSSSFSSSSAASSSPDNTQYTRAGAGGRKKVNVDNHPAFSNTRQDTANTGHTTKHTPVPSTIVVTHHR